VETMELLAVQAETFPRPNIRKGARRTILLRRIWYKHT
jgi:hypothetical protein